MAQLVFGIFYISCFEWSDSISVAVLLVVVLAVVDQCIVVVVRIAVDMAADMVADMVAVEKVAVLDIAFDDVLVVGIGMVVNVGAVAGTEKEIVEEDFEIGSQTLGMNVGVVVETAVERTAVAGYAAKVVLGSAAELETGGAVAMAHGQDFPLCRCRTTKRAKINNRHEHM